MVTLLILLVVFAGCLFLTGRLKMIDILNLLFTS